MVEYLFWNKEHVGSSPIPVTSYFMVSARSLLNVTTPHSIAIDV